MQRVGADRRKRIIFGMIIPCVLLLFLVAADQVTKYAFKALHESKGDTVVIKDFFYFTCVYNSGAAFSFLSDKEWGQTFFKVLTAVALAVFIFFFVLSVKHKKKWCTYSLSFVIGGTIGNYIDRLLRSAVIDFIGFDFGSYSFPVFNFADICLTVGIIMLVVYFLFMEESAPFSKRSRKKRQEKTEEKTENEDV